MTPNAERVTFTKKKKTVACPVPLAPLADTHAHLLSFWGKDVPETLVRAKGTGQATVFFFLVNVTRAALDIMD